MIAASQVILCYNREKVLKRPHIAEYNTPVSSAFFTSKDYLWPSVGLIKDLIRQGICQPSICGFEHLATSLSKKIGEFQNNI